MQPCNEWMNVAGGGREGVLQEHLEYLQPLKALQGSGVVRSKPDRKSCCSTGKGGNFTLKGERSPGQALAGTGWSHTEFTPLMSQFWCHLCISARKNLTLNFVGRDTYCSVFFPRSLLIPEGCSNNKLLFFYLQLFGSSWVGMVESLSIKSQILGGTFPRKMGTAECIYSEKP